MVLVRRVDPVNWGGAVFAGKKISLASTPLSQVVSTFNSLLTHRLQVAASLSDKIYEYATFERRRLPGMAQIYVKGHGMQSSDLDLGRIGQNLAVSGQVADRRGDMPWEKIKEIRKMGKEVQAGGGGAGAASARNSWMDRAGTVMTKAAVDYLSETRGYLETHPLSEPRIQKFLRDIERESYAGYVRRVEMDDAAVRWTVRVLFFYLMMMTESQCALEHWAELRRRGEA